MYNHLLYLLYWLVNGLVLYLGARLFPDNVLLGVNKFVEVEAAVYGGFWMTFVVWTIWDFATAQQFKFSKNMAWVYFAAANVLAVWAIGRLAAVTGVRIIGVEWVAVVAVAANWLQRGVWNKLVS